MPIPRPAYDLPGLFHRHAHRLFGTIVELGHLEGAGNGLQDVPVEPFHGLPQSQSIAGGQGVQRQLELFPLCDRLLGVGPGPGCLVHSVKRKLDASKLKAIILSHKHLDHSGDINIMIEAMTEGGWKQRGLVFAPSDALNEDAVILPYLRNYPQNIEILSEGKSYSIDNVCFETPVKHIHHGVEGYGFNIFGKKSSISIITDTGYFEGLESYYKEDILILNVVFYNNKKGFEHFDIKDVEKIIELNKPKLTILTHFGMTMVRNKPWILAENLSKKLGVKVIAARDGMEINLDDH